MNTVTLKAATTGAETLKWRRSRKGRHPEYTVEVDGTVKDVPVLAAIQLLEAGLAKLPDDAEPLPPLARAIEQAPGDHLSDFMAAHGEADHHFDRHTHIMSAKLRSEEPLTAADRKEIADQLDSMFSTLHYRGTGRIVVMTDDEKRQRCRELMGTTQPV